LFLILVVNSFGLVGLFIFLPRSIVYYEYALVLGCLLLFKRPVYAYIAFLFIFLLDLLNLFSSSYLFSIGEFLSNLKYASLFSLSIVHVFAFFVLLVYCAFVYYVLKRYSPRIKAERTGFLFIILFFYALIFSIDLYNGSSKFVETDKIFRFTKKNISSFLSKEYYYFINQNLYNDRSVPSALTKKEESATQVNLLGDDSNKQLLIIMESWGLPNDSAFHAMFQKTISSLATQRQFKPFWGQTKFRGSTTAAEMRELVSAKGSYKYFFNLKSSESQFPSIFDKKKTAGYETYGFHSFTGKMFARGNWWYNIGLEHIFFRDDILAANIVNTNQLDAGTPFPSVKDEQMFDYMVQQTKGSKRKFVYLLTVNTHLPFTEHIGDMPGAIFSEISKKQISSEAKSQMKKLAIELMYFINALNPEEWDDILFVGDHIPPYLRDSDRKYFNSEFVPYLFLTH
jgi:phosphoglycerol transferase MdoB-like AlkP superfamily enzyme